MLAEKKRMTSSETSISQRINTIAPFAITLSNQYLILSRNVTLRISANLLRLSLNRTAGKPGFMDRVCLWTALKRP